MDQRRQLSPGAAIAVGLLCAALGLVVVFMAFGGFGPSTLSPGTPPWVGALAGLVFVFGGLAVIVGYAIAGGATADGDLPPGTPTSVRVVQYLLGLGVSVSLALIGTWIALGAGPRHCTATGMLSAAVDDTVCRAVFGVGALLVWAFIVALSVVSYRRLQRS